MISKHSILKIRKNGEGADPAKIAENATSLLTRYGHTPEEIAELASADDAKINVLFSARRQALEDDVIARKGKELTSAGELNGKKYGYKNSEDRIKAAAAEYGFAYTDDELTPLQEKERIEGMLKILTDKAIAKAAANGNTPEEVKLIQAKLESQTASALALQKAAKEWEKKYGELQSSIPALQEKMQMDFYAEQSWKGVALKKDVLETLTVSDEGVLTNMVVGHMSQRGHKFAAEKQTDGTLRLSVVDKDGNYVQMTNSVGNHTPESYVAAIYEPLVKKSNAAQPGAGAPMQVSLTPDQLANLTPEMKKALGDMGKQSQLVTRN